MSLEEFKNYCLSMPGAEEKSPWTEPKYSRLTTFSVAGKWFCLLDTENRFCDLKCLPEQEEQLSAQFNGIFPAWHMDKRNWVGVRLDSDVPQQTIYNLIEQAYDLVVKSLPEKERTTLAEIRV